MLFTTQQRQRRLARRIRELQRRCGIEPLQPALSANNAGQRTPYGCRRDATGQLYALNDSGVYQRVNPL